MLNRLNDVFSSFEQHDVRYLVIGGIAAVLHGVPRATFDLDVLIEATPENASRLLSALEQAGLGTATLTTPEAVLDNEVTIFQDWVRIDVQTSTPGIGFASRTRRSRPKTEGPNPILSFSTSSAWFSVNVDIGAWPSSRWAPACATSTCCGPWNARGAWSPSTSCTRPRPGS